MSSYSSFVSAIVVLFLSTHLLNPVASRIFFICWFRNETTLVVLWDPPPSCNSAQCTAYISPQDAVESVSSLERTELTNVIFTGLVPGRAYTIEQETSNVYDTPGSVLCHTIPLKPSSVNVDESTITTHEFKMSWKPPDNPRNEFDKYEVSVTENLASSTHVIIQETFNKTTKTEYVVNRRVLPGHSYNVSVKTISRNVKSQSTILNVTLKPLPVEDVRVTPELVVVWRVNQISEQDTFVVYSEDEVSGVMIEQEVSGDINELTLTNLLPGRKYRIKVEAISHGMRSESRSTFCITRPMAPILNPVISEDYGVNITWKSDVSYGQEIFKVLLQRNEDTSKIEPVLTNNTRVFFGDLYPGACYSVQVVSISKYDNESVSEISTVVRPLSPENVTAVSLNTSSISVKWTAPENSLVSYYRVQYRNEDEVLWSQPSYKTKQTFQNLTNLVSGKRYMIQVFSMSSSVESTPVEIFCDTPGPVALLSPHVITLKFPPPPRQVDLYNVTWTSNGTESTRQFPGNSVTRDKFVLIPIDKLSPGVEYVFIITSSSHIGESWSVNVSARTWPVIDSEIVFLEDHGRNISLTVKFIPPRKMSFDLFRFQISNTSSPAVDKMVNDSNTRVVFHFLTPGKLYDVKIWTVSEELTSVPTELQYRLQPDPISGIRSTNLTKTSVTLLWDPPRGEFSHFEVKYLDTILQTPVPSIDITELNPYTNYSFYVSAIADSQSSRPSKSPEVSVEIQTSESIPGRVKNFRPLEVNAENITLAWSLPERSHHGILLKFSLSVMVEGSGHWSVRDFGPKENQGTLTALRPGKIYKFKIKAQTRIGYGPETLYVQELPPLAPPQPNDRIFPTVVLETSSTIQIRFRKNFFSEENGKILAYTIIVSEDLNDNSVILNLPSWQDVQSVDPWPPYQVLAPRQFFTRTSVVEFTIGEETCGPHVEYCNGYLKSGTTYKVKVRAFTRADLFTDTVYSYPVSTEKISNIIYILGFTVICLFVFTLFLFFGRKLPGFLGNPVDTCDTNLQNFSRPISITHFKTMNIDPILICKEFEEIKLVGRNQTTAAAELTCNRPKNRFSDILPYDSSRYKLQPVDDEDGSDYINANYIAGHPSPRQFIATQGPLSSTRDDFWRMCWESRTPAIVMLAQCVENGRGKCDLYWPVGKRVLNCGSIDVKLRNVCRYAGWRQSHLSLSRGTERRDILHFHFTTWPDCGVPESPHDLVRFVLAFRARIPAERNPVVVHCSAGVGRTGTFIALDTIIQRLSAADGAGSVDILGVVCQMRKHRMKMVQTEEQYIYIYECVKLLLQGDVNHLPETELHSDDAFESDEGVDDL